MNYLKVVGLFLVASFLLVSCSKENMLEEEVKEETPEYTMEVNVGERSITSAAFAVYCDNNGKSELRVSNNLDYLDTEWDLTSLEDGDFLFIQQNDGTTEYALGGGFYSAELTGLEFGMLSITPDLNFNVESNDGITAVGSMNGDIFLIDMDGNTATFPLEVNYTAEVIGTSTFCD